MSSAVAARRVIRGVEAARVPGTRLPTNRLGPTSVNTTTVDQPTRSTRGASSDEHRAVCRATGRGDVLNEFELPVRLQQAGWGADWLPRTPGVPGRGDQGVGHGAGGQVDHEIVDGVALPRSTTSKDRMSAPTEPSATASEPRVLRPSSSSTCRRMSASGPLFHSSHHPRPG